MTSIDSFIGEVKPLGSITVNGKEYEIFSPDELEEKYYIKYFSARAKTMDIVHKYGQEQVMPDGTRRFVPSSNPADVAMSELEMIAPAKEMVRALLRIEGKDEVFDKVAAYPKYIVKLYMELEKILAQANVATPAETQLPGKAEEVEATDPLE